MRVKLFVTVLAFLVVPCLDADVTYSYVGQPFKFCDNGTQPAFLRCMHADSVSGSFTTSLDQFNLANLADYVIPASDITSYLFTLNGTELTFAKGSKQRGIVSNQHG